MRLSFGLVDLQLLPLFRKMASACDVTANGHMKRKQCLSESRGDVRPVDQGLSTIPVVHLLALANNAASLAEAETHTPLGPWGLSDKSAVSRV